MHTIFLLLAPYNTLLLACFFQNYCNFQSILHLSHKRRVTSVKPLNGNKKYLVLPVILYNRSMYRFLKKCIHQYFIFVKTVALSPSKARYDICVMYPERRDKINGNY